MQKHEMDDQLNRWDKCCEGLQSLQLALQLAGKTNWVCQKIGAKKMLQMLSFLQGKMMINHWIAQV